MRAFEPIDDLNDVDYQFWLEVTVDIISLEELERRATLRARYLAVRKDWLQRKGRWRKRC